MRAFAGLLVTVALALAVLDGPAALWAALGDAAALASQLW